MIFEGRDTKLPPPKSFEERLQEFSINYDNDKPIYGPVVPECKKCEFRATREEEAEGKKSGIKECWEKELGWNDADFETPTFFEVWNLHYTKRDKLLQDKRIKITDVTQDDITIKPKDGPGLSQSQRQWLQIEKLQKGDMDLFIDKKGLSDEINKWKFPLHFIDFETSTPAIPFNKGRRPYEQIAFQFSHHKIHEDGTVEHAGQHLEEKVGVFPNYDFLRKLRDELNNDCGSIFRYADHENSVLCAIREQLIRDSSEIEDSEELIGFIEKITHSPKEEKENPWKGPRDMIDLQEMVVKYYYDPFTRGSNSIKYVLPAMLNRSAYLQEKYSGLRYGTEIRSLNFPEGKSWVEFENGSIADPYSLLPPLFGNDFIARLSEDDKLKDGGAAMMAYALLQFEEMSEEERISIRAGLLRYCELDTLAMGMLYEGWREMVN